MSLKRDGRISLTGFEVSAISVREMLLRDLGDNENDILLAGVVIKPKFVDGLNGLEIGGELSQAQRTALSRYFAKQPLGAMSVVTTSQPHCLRLLYLALNPPR